MNEVLSIIQKMRIPLTFENIQETTGLSERNLHEILSNLLKEGHLELIPSRRGNGNFSKFIYTLSKAPFCKMAEGNENKELRRNFNSENGNYSSKGNYIYIFSFKKIIYFNFLFFKLKRKSIYFSKKNKLEKEKGTAKKTAVPLKPETGFPYNMNSEVEVQESDLAKFIFDFWNILGPPLTRHRDSMFYPRRLKNGHPSMGFRDSIVSAMRLHSFETVLKTIRMYHSLITHPMFIYNTATAGPVVSLEEFFKGYSGFNRHRVRMANPDLLKFESWFDELRNPDNAEKYLHRVTQAMDGETAEFLRIAFLTRVLKKTIKPGEDTKVYFGLEDQSKINGGANKLLKLYNELQTSRKFQYNIPKQDFVTKFVIAVRDAFTNTISPGNLVSNYSFTKVFPEFLRKNNLVRS